MILYKKRIYFLYFFIFISFSFSYGQDAHYSQFYANPIDLNPAFAGTINCPRFCINFRDQWPAIPHNFISSSVSYDQHINVLHGGIGVLVSADLEGGSIFQTYNASFIYNFRMRVTDRFNLQLALQTGYLASIFNWKNGLTFATDHLYEAAPDILPTDYNYTLNSKLDLGSGFVGYTRNVYFGLAVQHLVPINTSFFIINKDNKGVKWTAHIGGKITLLQHVRNEDNYGDISLYPNIVFISQKNFHYLHEGFYFKFLPFTIGTWMRHNFKSLDAFIVSIGVEYKSLRIGYSYDFNISKLEHSGGAHEVSLQFVIPCNNEKIHSTTRKKFHKISPVQCPNF